MPTWLSVLLVIVVVLCAGFLVERRRMARLQSWSEARGFRQLSPMPPDLGVRLQPFLALIEPTAFLGWGLILQGEHDGGSLVMAEYRVSGGRKRPDQWRTLAALSVAQADYPLACWRRHGAAPAGQRAAAAVENAAVAPSSEIVHQLGAAPREPAPLPAEAGWTVWEGRDRGRAAESHERRLGALEAWDLPDALGTAGPYVLVVRENTVKESELDGLLRAVSRAQQIVKAMPKRQTA